MWQSLGFCRTVILSGCCAIFLTASLHLSAAAEDDTSRSFIGYAKVLNVNPLSRTESVPTSRKVCERISDRRERSVASPPDYSGRLVLGGILGGLVGHQLGGGRGKKALTIAGALLGAGIASRPTTRSWRDRTDNPRNRRRCRIVREYQDRQVEEGYLVTYEVAGHRFVRKTKHRPSGDKQISMRISPLPGG